MAPDVLELIVELIVAIDEIEVLATALDELGDVVKLIDATLRKVFVSM